MANKQRLEQDIETLRHITDPCEGGVTRIGFTPKYREGVEYFKARMLETGLKVREDDIGNVYGVYEGTDPTAPVIISGSHLDSVRCAGAFDGIAGAVCALEVARMLKENNIKLKHSFEVIGVIEEEGTCCGQVLVGSQFITGDLTKNDLQRLKNDDGKTLAEIVKEYSHDQQTVPAYRRNDNVKAFVELHDEQGPVLENTGTDIGIVQSIVGIAQLSISTVGFAGHAGTVPMYMRQDAGVAACAFVSHINNYVLRKYTDKATATIGKFNLLPGSSNCIPSKCTFTVDIRAGDASFVTDIIEQIKKQSELIETEFNVSSSVKVESFKDPIQMDPTIQKAIISACDKLGFSHRSLNSGAGHDAMIFASIWKTAMLFVPCDKGITHNPEEKVTWEDMAKGADVLYETILLIDQSND